MKDNTASSRYKTELCRPFTEYTHCKYGEKCQFAHGPAELRSTSRHPKYKTELCKTYHTLGLCPYGHRCHFVHEDNEALLRQGHGNSNMSSAATTPTSSISSPSPTSSINESDFNFVEFKQRLPVFSQFSGN